MHLAGTAGVFLLSSLTPAHNELVQTMSSSAMPHTATLVASATSAVCAVVKSKSAQFASSKDLGDNPFSSLISKVRGISQSEGDSGDNLEKDPNKLRRRVTLDQEFDLFEDGLVVKPIGVVHSIYRLCVGTPRQGLLAPHARGRVELSVKADCVLGLEEYSHVWIVFCFHLNTVSKNKLSKIAPPALGGEKVGVLTTRSPHRPNPIGMTLCKLDSITKPTKHRKKTYLEVSGLDLVDGTPVLDIKPYVPHYDSVEGLPPQVPHWVQSGLSTSRGVAIKAEARQELEHILNENPTCLDFYGPHRGDDSVLDTVEKVLLCIKDVLAVDVRSAYQTSKVRKGNFQAERAERVQDVVGSNSNSNKGEDSKCTQQLDQLLIHYSVMEPENSKSASRGSGAEDVVTVESIKLLDDPDRHNVELAREASKAEMIPSDELSDLERNQGTRMLAKAQATKNSSGEGEEKDTREHMQEDSVPSRENQVDAASATQQRGDIGDSSYDAVETTSGVSAIDTSSPSVSRSERLDGDCASPGLSPAMNKKCRGSAAKLPSNDKGPTMLAPPGDAEFSELKSYWSEAASHHTPTGLVPEKLESFRKLESERFYSPSDKSPRRVGGKNQKNEAEEESKQAANKNDEPGAGNGDQDSAD